MRYGRVAATMQKFRVKQRELHLVLIDLENAYDLLSSLEVPMREK